MLNERQKQFCQEFIIDFNATQAAIRAGYSKRSAYSIAGDLLKKHETQVYLKELIEKRNKRLKITQDEVVADIIEVKNRCMQKIPVMHYDKENKEFAQTQDELGRDIWQFDAANANKALDMLMKYTGGYELDNKSTIVMPSIEIEGI